MSSKRFDICVPRKNGEKTYWSKIGSAWQNDKGIQLVFDALPLPDAEGRCVANLFEPKPRDGQQQRGQSRQSGDREVYNSNSGWASDDSDAPF